MDKVRLGRRPVVYETFGMIVSRIGGKDVYSQRSLLRAGFPHASRVRRVVKAEFGPPPERRWFR